MNKQTDTLFFGKGNAKVGKEIWTFSLPAGHTCPGARACMARADRGSGRITDGAEQEFRCFAASMERYAGVRERRWENFEALKGLSFVEMVELIEASLPINEGIIRVHVGGDFFSNSYFAAWMKVAVDNPDILFYAYTKSLNYWVRNIEIIPVNFKLTASRGGRYDALIEKYNLRTATVLHTLQEAVALALEVDHDDSHAYRGNESFALLVHGTQPKRK